MKPWVVVDIETSGLDPHVHEVIEIGMVGGDGSEWECSIPFDLDKADPKALEVNGWGTRKFAPLVQQMEAVNTMHKVFHKTGTLIVASPAHFDVGFLEALFRKNTFQPPWGHRSVIDLKSFACARLGVLTDLKNSEIARLFDIPEPEDKHTALADARWTARLFRALLDYDS